MKKNIVFMIVFMLCSLIANAQFSKNEAPAQGTPPLTNSIVNKVQSLFEYALDIKLSNAQRQRFRQGIAAYWTKNNREKMRTISNNAELANSPEKMKALREVHQTALVEALRREAAGGDAAPAVLIEAFDSQHPELGSATKIKGFNDLIGNWKSEDYLIAEEQNGVIYGNSYTDSRTLQISADGRFKHRYVHENFDNSRRCSRLDSKWEEGTVAIEGAKLVFKIKTGTEMVKDTCSGANAQSAVKPRILTFSWSIRPHVFRPKETMLCWTTEKNQSVCYTRQN